MVRWFESLQTQSLLVLSQGTSFLRNEIFPCSGLVVFAVGRKDHNPGKLNKRCLVGSPSALRPCSCQPRANGSRFQTSSMWRSDGATLCGGGGHAHCILAERRCYQCDTRLQEDLHSHHHQPENSINVIILSVPHNTLSLLPPRSEFGAT